MSTGGLALVLSLLVIIFGQMNRWLEGTVRTQLDAINRGNLSMQVGRNLLMDMGQVSLRNPKMRDILTRNGYTVTPNQPAAGTEGANR